MELWDAVPAWAQNGSQLNGSLSKIKTVRIHSVMGAMAAQTVTSASGSGPHVILWSLRDISHPLGGSNIGMVIPQHTPLSLWAGEESQEYKLEFPHHCYFVTGNKLCGYAPRSKSLPDICVFNPPGAKSGPATAETAALSKIHRSWLIFFRSYSLTNSGKGIEEWTYTLVREDEIGASTSWFKPGLSALLYLD